MSAKTAELQALATNGHADHPEISNATKLRRLAARQDGKAGKLGHRRKAGKLGHRRKAGLFCTKCNRFANKSGQTEQKDGTITHNECGTPLELVSSTPVDVSAPAAPVRKAKAARRPRKAAKAPRGSLKARRAWQRRNLKPGTNEPRDSPAPPPQGGNARVQVLAMLAAATATVDTPGTRFVLTYTAKGWHLQFTTEAAA